MRAVDIIAHKRDGGELSSEEIAFFIEGYTRGTITDYQASAWLMAVYWRGMTEREIVDLTNAMAHSGDVLDFTNILPIVVDKHSSGGVGDKTTLIVLPIVAACGVPVAKMSGRGLGYSGGTIDKLEAIPGYRVILSEDEFIQQVKKIGIVLTSQSANLAPADGKLYALRDVTATVPSLPLIASSIMSKKIAAGAQAIVLDVKVGMGAFMPTIEEARVLAKMMVGIGRGVGRQTVAMLSDMNQPLGSAVGNALEVAEAVECLHNKGAQDLRDHCLTVAAYMLWLANGGKPDDDIQPYTRQASDKLRSGAAFEKFVTLIKAQGGDPKVINDPSLLSKARYTETLTATRDGYVRQINALHVGMAAVELGAGRARKDDSIDHAVGIIVHKKVGETIMVGEPTFTIHANDTTKLARAKQMLHNTLVYSDQATLPLPTFYDIFTD